MRQRPRPPVPVIVAATLYLLFGLLIAAGSLVNWAAERDTVSLVMAPVALGLTAALAWGLWKGSRQAMIVAVAFGVLLFLTTVSYHALRLVAIPVGVAEVLLLTVPAAARAHFRKHTQPQPN